MIRSVVKRGDLRLQECCQEITDITQAQELITDLWDTLIAIQGLYKFTRGSGIAAPQIGQLWRANAVEFEGQRYTLINPVVTAHSTEKILVSEGCLSFFDYRGKALRWADVTIEALNEQGEPFTVSSNGDPNFASLLQHEVWHLDGLLYTSAMPSIEELVYHPEKPIIP
jgi:peptide deformylase